MHCNSTYLYVEFWKIWYQVTKTKEEFSVGLSSYKSCESNHLCQFMLCRSFIWLVMDTDSLLLLGALRQYTH